MKILLVQVKRIGDLILTTPVIKALREAKPHCHITVIADSSAASLLPALGVDQTWTFERAGLLANLFRPSINSWIKSDLPFSEFAYCLDFTGTDRSALVSALAGGSKRVTYERFRSKFLRPQIYQQFVDSSVRLRHTADYHTDLLRPLGIEVENVPMELHLPELIHAEVRAKLENHEIEGAYAVIHAGTARPEKYWEPDRWAQVIEFLRSQYGLTTILTGSSDPAEQAHLAAIKAALKLPCVDLSGDTNLLELATSFPEHDSSEESIPRRCTSPTHSASPALRSSVPRIPFTGVPAIRAAPWSAPTRRRPSLRSKRRPDVSHRRPPRAQGHRDGARLSRAL